MQFGRKVGLLLIVIAFVAAAADKAARGLSGETTFFGIMSASTVLDVLAPNFMSNFAIAIEEHLHPIIWDPLILGILAFPGWLLAGLPGIVLMWKCRQLPVGGEATKEELAYNTYEDVLAAAEEADSHNPGEDIKYKTLKDYDPLDPPSDGIVYEDYGDLPIEASDLADFRNDISVFPVISEPTDENENKLIPQSAKLKNVKSQLPNSGNLDNPGHTANSQEKSIK
ncbi:MAG: hypothetical protein VX617_00130 [Pseudomonadota bacterium]|nr:hypothetical protein [Pseudomonadota bacterium]